MNEDIMMAYEELLEQRSYLIELAYECFRGNGVAKEEVDLQRGLVSEMSSSFRDMCNECGGLVLSLDL